MNRRRLVLTILAVAGILLSTISIGCQRRGQASRSGSRPRLATVQGAPKDYDLDLGDGVKMTFALIPAGKFTMGGPKDPMSSFCDCSPAHEVTLTNAFYMAIYEVTQAQYRQVMGESPAVEKGDQLPVNDLRWHEAVDFCDRLSEHTGKTVRLPTEAEWEYACRAGSTTRFSFGDDESELEDYAWYSKNRVYSKESKLPCQQPVGQKKPNAYGLYDMHGGVAEWCADNFGRYSATAKTDPGGPSHGEGRIVRGGSDSDRAAECQSMSR